jgi:recombination protein RecR
VNRGMESQLVAPPVARLIEALSALPGIGPKSASRLTFHLLRTDRRAAEQLAQAILDLRAQVGQCSRCFNMAVGPLCAVCAATTRDQSLICVVEEPLDVLAIERTGTYRGVYHVLHGHLAPLEGIYREHLRIDELVLRVQSEPIREVILATNPNTEGEATAFMILRELTPLGVKVTRPARGLPTGGDLEWADPDTLGMALEGRRTLS